MKKTIKVKLDEQSVDIEKLPLGKYTELLQAIQQLPEHISGFDKLTNDEIFKKLPEIVGKSLPDVIHILTIATPLKKEAINELGLDEVTKLVVGIIEVNNYREVYDNIKKAMARPEIPQIASLNGSGGQ